jgi:hypothetical protein
MIIAVIIAVNYSRRRAGPRVEVEIFSRTLQAKWG